MVYNLLRGTCKSQAASAPPTSAWGDKAAGPTCRPYAAAAASYARCSIGRPKCYRWTWERIASLKYALPARSAWLSWFWRILPPPLELGEPPELGPECWPADAAAPTPTAPGSWYGITPAPARSVAPTCRTTRPGSKLPSKSSGRLRLRRQQNRPIRSIATSPAMLPAMLPTIASESVLLPPPPPELAPMDGVVRTVDWMVVVIISPVELLLCGSRCVMGMRKTCTRTLINLIVVPCWVVMWVVTGLVEGYVLGGIMYGSELLGGVVLEVETRKHSEKWSADARENQ
jgi:hypothetical protein